MRNHPPIVITGLGAASAFGVGVEALRTGLIRGVSASDEITLFDASPFDVRIAAQVPGPLAHQADTTRCAALSLAATTEAWREAAVQNRPSESIAVVMGSSAGGVESVEKYQRAIILGEGPADISVLRTCGLGSLSDSVSAALQVTGPRLTTTTACSSSAVAIAVAFDLVSEGRADMAVAGGAEALSEYVFAGFHSLMVLDPETCRPFDSRRQGLVLGEGAAAVVLETEDHARARGVAPLAILRGYGMCCDSSHLTAPEESGREVARTVRLALEQTGVDAGDIDHVDAHGTATLRGDVAEIRGLSQVFGDHFPVTTVGAIKSQLGHSLGAAGALGVVASVLQIRGGIVFPTAGLESVDPDCAANHVIGSARASNPRTVLSNSFSFGGNNIALVIQEAGHE